MVKRKELGERIFGRVRGWVCSKIKHLKGWLNKHLLSFRKHNFTEKYRKFLKAIAMSTVSSTNKLIGVAVIV